jgi:pyridoxine 5-phosphate synthase
MVKLSVNVNKVATLRNSRGGAVPSVIAAVQVCVKAGAPGITVHPRSDERHITKADVHEIAAELKRMGKNTEFNMEGDPRQDFLDLVADIRPTQCTLVPVKPGEITSQAGWPPDTSRSALRPALDALKSSGVRVSLFVDAEPDAVRWAAGMGADRIELYTEPFAREFHADRARGEASFTKFAQAAELAHSKGLGVNAGHDLDLHNLPLFKTLPYLDEVSIGHALISDALFVGLDRAVADYLRALQ